MNEHDDFGGLQAMAENVADTGPVAPFVGLDRYFDEPAPAEDGRARGLLGWAARADKAQRGGLDFIGNLLHQRALPCGIVELAIDADVALQQWNPPPSNGHFGIDSRHRLGCFFCLCERATQQQGSGQCMQFQADSPNQIECSIGCGACAQGCHD